MQRLRVVFSRFARAAMTGGVAFAVDLAALFLLLHCGFSAREANAPALVLALVTSFVLQRRWVFVAGAGSRTRQLVRFAIVEASALALGGVLFHVLARAFADSPARALALRAIIGQVTFLAWSFPLGHWVFPERDRARAN